MGYAKSYRPDLMVCERFFGFRAHFWSDAHKSSALARWGPYGFLEEIKTNRITGKSDVFHGLWKKLQAQLGGVRALFWFSDRFWVRCARVKRSRSMGTLWLRKGSKIKRNHKKNQKVIRVRKRLGLGSRWGLRFLLVFGPFSGPSPQVKRSRSMGTLWLSRGDKNKQNHMKNQRF
jgi:hypothetical protein